MGGYWELEDVGCFETEFFFEIFCGCFAGISERIMLSSTFELDCDNDDGVVWREEGGVIIWNRPK